MASKKQTATPATTSVAAVAAELSASPEKLEAYIASHIELEEKHAKAEATIAELMASNENLGKASEKAEKTTVNINGKVHELAIPSSYVKVDGEMVLVDAVYLNNNPKLAEQLLKQGHGIFKKEEAQ